MNQTLPLSPKATNRVLIVLVLALALALGYYHNRWEISQRQLTRLQLRYTQLQESINPTQIK